MAERTYKPGEGKTQNEILQQKRRFWELDFLRGLCVMLMMVDHFFFSAADVLEQAVWPWAKPFWTGLNELAQIYWVSQARVIARFVVMAIFFLICGISCTLSHNNLVRSLKAVAAALTITMATYLAGAMLGTDMVIIFGVIHMLAVAMLLFSLFDLLGRLLGWLTETKKTKPLSLWIRRLLPAAVGIAGLIVFFTLPMGHFETVSSTVIADGKSVEFFYTELVTNLHSRGRDIDSFIYLLVEIRPSPFFTSDYFPIMPYAFIVLVGSGIGQLFYKTRARAAVGAFFIGFAQKAAQFGRGRTEIKGGISALAGYFILVFRALARISFNKHTASAALIAAKVKEPVGFVGKHALLFYLLHQLAIVAFFFAVGGFYYIFR